MDFSTRFKNAWNAFTDKKESDIYDVGPSWSTRPDRVKIFASSEGTIISSIYNRIAVDVSAFSFEHIRTDNEGRYLETIEDELNNCLTLEANKDQTASDFILDIVESLLEEGCVAVVPIETSGDIWSSSSYKIYSMRTGKIVGWHPDFVDVNVFNGDTGLFQQITMPKQRVAIINNPFYSVMNKPNSTLKRLTYKLSLLDDADSKNNSSKLDMVIKLPYAIKSEAQKKRAEDRKKSIENQLANSKYGIAYVDSTEQITQLNRPVENNLLEQINVLTRELYAQLGLDESIINGTAGPDAMNNYYTRVVAPIVSAITDEFERKFLTKTARSQYQTIRAFQEPFKYISVMQIAQLVDTLSRNEVVTGNEFRTSLGFKPSSDPSADELRNKNLIDMGNAEDQEDPYGEYTDNPYGFEENQNGSEY